MSAFFITCDLTIACSTDTKRQPEGWRFLDAIDSIKL